MSLDFLRNLAFDGELTNFFREDAYQFGERSTGLHLRFDPQFLRHIGENVDSKRENVDNWFLSQGFRVRLNEILSFWNDRDWKSHNPYWFCDTEENRRRIVQIVADVASADDPLLAEGPRDFEGFPIVYRELGPIIPHYAPGSCIMVPNAKRGTLCGFLRDHAANRSFALTCGHVVRTVGSAVTDPNGKLVKLGSTYQLNIPNAQGNCNRYVRPQANGLDAALIEVDPNTSLTPGQPRAVESISAINCGDFVEFMGQGSRRARPGMVMSATIWKPIDLLGDGNLICCGDIFEISHRANPYVSSPLSKPGDSGAAITKDGAPDRWLGMLIGGQRSSSFVCYAEHIIDWADQIIPGVTLYP